MKRNLLPTALALLLLSSPSGAVEWGGTSAIKGVKKVNQSGMQFLKIGQSARAAGMGDAFTAVADDINAMYFNGAGLTRLRRIGYQATYTRWLAGSNAYAMAVAWNTGSTRGEVIGLSVTAFQPEAMEETTILQPEGTGQTVRYSDTAVGLLYAVKFTDKFSFSGRVSFAQEKLHSFTTSAVTFDLGSYFYTGFQSLRVAMALKNFGPDRKADALPYLMPLYFQAAVAGEVFGEKGRPFYVTLDVESAFAVDYEQRYLVGAEAWVKDTLAIRAGYKHNYDLERFAFGLGFRQALRRNRTVTLDLAYAPLQKQSGIQVFDPVLRVSLGGAF